MAENKLTFAPLNGFEMTVRYVDNDMGAAEYQSEHHVHAECEIYINLGGDVSFMVEDHLYPIRYGNIVITRPYEYHHCIYHSRTPHPHFWILFSGEHNEKILEMFFGRQKGKQNLFALGNEQTKELISLCHALCHPLQSEIDKYFRFFKLLRLFEGAKELNETGMQANHDVAFVLQSIHQNYAERITIRGLADRAHISVSTLERWFDENLNMSPSTYIKKIRLANAARLLAEQTSVTEAAESCGFSDVSAFITAFKKHYGATPLQYKKKAKHEQNSISIKTEKGEGV